LVKDALCIEPSPPCAIAAGSGVIAATARTIVAREFFTASLLLFGRGRKTPAPRLQFTGELLTLRDQAAART
jgi:hypothetical protein